MLDNLVLNSDNINRQKAKIREQFVASFIRTILVSKNGLTYCDQIIPWININIRYPAYS